MKLFYLLNKENQMTKLLHCKYICIAWTSILISFILICCSSHGANDEGELFIKVLDAPASFQQLSIVVDRISIHRTGASSEIGWTTVSTNSSGSFDLLNLRNGRNLQLVLSKVPVGTYDQIKINYGACTIIEQGQEQKKLYLDQASGNSIAYSFQIIEGQQLQLTFDYNSYSSVYKIGGQYFFKPVVRVQNTLLSGWITGSVVRPDTLPDLSIVHTFTGVDSVTTLCDPNGSFQLSDLPEGTYSVIIVPEDTSLVTDTISNISVIRKLPTNLGAIQLKNKW